MIAQNILLEIGPDRPFYYKGKWYVAHVMLYSDGIPKVKAYLKENPSQELDEDVLIYAHDLLEDLGFI